MLNLICNDISGFDKTTAHLQGKEEGVKLKRFNVEQMVTVLKQVKLETPVVHLIHPLGNAEQTFY